MLIQDALVDLVPRFDHTAVLEEPAAGSVRIGRLQPGNKFSFNESHRRAIVAPPPSRWQARVDVPPGAVLRLGIAVERPRPLEPGAPGVRFTVRVDGRQLFTRVLDPVERRSERRWVDVRIDPHVGSDLGGPRSMTFEFETRAVGAGRASAGLAGWSHVRLVRETWRTRQRVGQGSPSVVLLLVDTLRADRLGCYGARPTPSPVLDALAAHGLLVEQVVAQSSWTLPSVASILTGKHPRSHGVVGADFRRDDREGSDVEASDRPDPSCLPDALTTLAEAAQAAGLSTFAVSTNPLVSRETNLAQGFETFVELTKERGELRPPAADVNDALLAWLKENRGYRFFAYLHYMDVHGPYKPPHRFRPEASAELRPEVVAGEIDRVQKSIRAPGGRPLSAAELEYLKRLYDAQIRYWDAELGRLREGLEALGIAGTTVIVVTSDHGEGFLEHGHLKHGISLYDELLRVPFVVHGPGVLPRRVTVQGQGIDVFPTVASILGLELPAGLPGQDLLVASAVARPAVSETRWGFGDDGNGSSLVAMRTPHWKLIRPLTGERFEFYDLAADPDEQQDRGRDARAVQQPLAQLLDWERFTPPPPVGTGSDPFFHEKLEALGYIDEQER